MPETGHFAINISMKKRVDNKAQGLGIAFKLTIVFAAITLVTVLAPTFIWPPPYSHDQEKELVLYVLADIFCLGVAGRICSIFIQKKYNITNEELRDYYYSKPVIKVCFVIVLVSAIVKVIKSFL